MVPLESKEQGLDKACRIKSLIDDIQERVYKLKIFDRKQEIDAFCDELEIQVELSIESAIKHLHDIQRELLDEIRNHRRELQCASQQSPKSQLKETDSDSSLVEGSANQNLEMLALVVEKFSQECSTFLDQSGWDQESLNYALEFERELAAKTKDVAKRMREEAFNGKFLKFFENHLFNIQRDYLGTLKYLKEEHLSPETCRIHIDESPFVIQSHHYKEIISLGFFWNDILASGANDEMLLLWNHKKGERVFIDLTDQPTSAFADISSGGFLTGSSTGVISYWQWNKLKFVRPECCFSIQAHEAKIVLFKVLRDGLFASFSMDGSLKIWSLSGLREGNNLLKITGHGCIWNYFNVDLLSNGYIVTCSTDFEKSFVRVWNPRDGRMVKEINPGLNCITGLCVLSNDDIVLSTHEGLIKSFNLLEPSSKKTISDGKNLASFTGHSELRAMLKLPNSWLLAVLEASNKAFLQVWDSQNCKLVQSIQTPHTKAINSYDISPCGKYLATGSADRTIQIWNLSYFHDHKICIY